MIKAEPGWYVLHVQKKGRSGKMAVTPVVGWDASGTPICSQKPGSGFSGKDARHMIVSGDDIDPVTGRSFEDIYADQQRADIHTLRQPKPSKPPPVAPKSRRKKPWER